jgi:N6-adenosine-specific RNA methylase IME4
MIDTKIEIVASDDTCTDSISRQRYSVILADVPWSYRDHNTNGNRGACCKYDTMTIDEVKPLRLFIDDLAAPDCALFLWATSPMVADGSLTEVFHAWNFSPVTEAFCWVKTTPSKPMQVGGVNLSIGLGHWTRSGVESCWLGVRGRPKRISCSVRQVILADRREHSRKPDEIYHRIEQLMGDVPRVELFARQKYPGWDQALSYEADMFEPERRAKNV